MKYTFTIIFSLLFTFVCFSQTDLVETITHDGISRSYRLHLPTNYDGSVAYPLVFNFHGYGSNAQQQELYTQMSTLSNTENFIVCHPEGVGNAWNVGLGGTTADDVGFTDALLDELIANYNIDASRVYSTGMSNGGYMSYKLACELTDRFAAIASVTGSMVPAEYASCSPSRSIPVMQIHGTADGTVQYNGSSFATPIEDVVDLWVGFNNCDLTATITPVADNDPGDNSTAELFEYTNCDDMTMVSFYKITNGGHTWPDGLINLTGEVTNRDFNASQVIWDFFSQFQIPASVSTTELNQSIVMSIQPNPSTMSSTIQAEGLLSVRVFDLLGKEILIQNSQGNTMELNTSAWTNGTYFIQVETEFGIKTEKLIKQ